MGGMTSALRKVAILMLSALLAGCTGGGPAPPTATATESSPANARVLVSGTQDCSIDDDTTETTQGLVTTIVGTLRCTDVMSDPRVSGADVGTVTLVYADLPNLEIDRWSVEMTITTDGGVWHGTGWGSEFWDDAGGLRTSGTILYIGEGAYEGLSYRVLIAQSPEWELTHYIMSGWIQPAD